MGCGGSSSYGAVLPAAPQRFRGGSLVKLEGETNGEFKKRMAARDKLVCDLQLAEIARNGEGLPPLRGVLLVTFHAAKGIVDAKRPYPRVCLGKTVLKANEWEAVENGSCSSDAVDNSIKVPLDNNEEALYFSILNHNKVSGDKFLCGTNMMPLRPLLQKPTRAWYNLHRIDERQLLPGGQIEISFSYIPPIVITAHEGTDLVKGKHLVQLMAGPFSFKSGTHSTAGTTATWVTQNDFFLDETLLGDLEVAPYLKDRKHHDNPLSPATSPTKAARPRVKQASPAASASPEQPGSPGETPEETPEGTPKAVEAPGSPAGAAGATVGAAEPTAEYDPTGGFEVEKFSDTENAEHHLIIRGYNKGAITNSLVANATLPMSRLRKLLQDKEAEPVFQTMSRVAKKVNVDAGKISISTRRYLMYSFHNDNRPFADNAVMQQRLEQLEQENIEKKHVEQQRFEANYFHAKRQTATFDSLCEVATLDGQSECLPLKGMIYMTVHRAKGLYNTASIGSQDPLLTASFGQASWSTVPHVSGGDVFTTQQVLRMQLNGEEKASDLYLAMMAKKKVSNSLVGCSAAIPVMQCVAERQVNKWCPLQNVSGKNLIDAGKVCISTRYVPPLVINTHECKDLCDDSKSPYVKFTVGKEIAHRTPIVKNGGMWPKFPQESPFYFNFGLLEFAPKDYGIGFDYAKLELEAAALVKAEAEAATAAKAEAEAEAERIVAEEAKMAEEEAEAAAKKEEEEAAALKAEKEAATAAAEAAAAEAADPAPEYEAEGTAVEAKEAEPAAVEAEGAEPAAVEAKKAEPAAVEAEEAEPAAVEAEGAEPAAVEAEGAEPAAVEAEGAKSEPKAEPVTDETTSETKEPAAEPTEPGAAPVDPPPPPPPPPTAPPPPEDNGNLLADDDWKQYTVLVEVFSKKSIGSDTLLGTLQIPIKALFKQRIAQKGEPVWYSLTKEVTVKGHKEKQTVPAGEICLSTTGYLSDEIWKLSK